MGADPEVDAIGQVIDALEPLDSEARARVLEYTSRRLGMALVERNFPDTHNEPGATQAPAPVSDDPSTPTDIRSIREVKQPHSDTAMAAIVGYYLSDVASPSERRGEINRADIEKYFKQAGHPLPSRPENTLSNAAAAGYFDSKGQGMYALNPVGTNLVTHGLPKASNAGTKPRKRRKVATASRKADSKKRQAKKPKRTKRK
jgi:hypothetical protein